MTSDLDIRERARVAALMAQPDAVFVFGSNIDGQHASGAARVAFDLYGAEWGVGEGLRGRSYALPTMLPFVLLELRGRSAFRARSRKPRTNKDVERTQKIRSLCAGAQSAWKVTQALPQDISGRSAPFAGALPVGRHG